MTTTTSPRTARRFAELADNSQSQAALYRKMADALLAIVDGTPDPQTTLGIEVDRMLNLADELDGDAEENRKAALLAGYNPDHA